MKRLLLLLFTIATISGQDFSLSFDGVDDWVSISNGILNQRSEFAIKISIKPDFIQDNAARVIHKQIGGMFHVIINENEK